MLNDPEGEQLLIVFNNQGKLRIYVDNIRAVQDKGVRNSFKFAPE